MLQSMTGFATKTIALENQTEKVHISLQLKTLNGRYFEANCRLPQVLSHFEVDLIKHFKKALLRGTVYFTMHVDNYSFFKGEIIPAMSTLSNYVSALETIKSSFAIQGDITLDLVSRLPNIFVDQEKQIDEQYKATFMKTVQSLIAEVIQEREKEGESIKHDLQKRIAIMRKDIGLIATYSSEMIQEQKDKTNQIMLELSGDPSELAEMRKNAVYGLLDKIDIHEEISRFNAHVDNLETQLDSAAIEKGKKIDFTLQEMVREINTIAAKCSSAKISSIAINLKVEIEKAREQCQNIV